MYSYSYDPITGGLILNTTPTGFSKEPRPVYAAELDLLGFDKFWKYDNQVDLPYMWAESNAYWYRGKCVAKLKGGNVYNAPEIIIPVDDSGNSILPEEDNCLRPIDLATMLDLNSDMLEILEQTTVKKILAIYNKYKNKLDIFHVAFSGGKDSAVLLDLVKKALPKGSFVVVFGDTGMEFPDTYEAIEKTRQMCAKEEIPFYTAKSHLDPQESWKLFGPPSRVLRWCCSVHKSTPQTLALRQITGKDNYTGLAFVGVRAAESSTRAEYEYENYGKKQKGQYSHNSILEWTSAEIWLYLLANNIVINDAYKKGSSRVGCICCPMGGGKASYVENMNYPMHSEIFLSTIIKSNIRKTISSEDYVVAGGWNARKNGCFIVSNDVNYSETMKDGELVIKVNSSKEDWREWIKTLGDLSQVGKKYFLSFRGKSYEFTHQILNDGYIVRLSELIMKDSPLFGKLFRQVFRKSAYCLNCKTCEAICNHKSISMENGVKIDNCRHCLNCHSMELGCLAYHSLNIPNVGDSKMKSLNSLSNHAPKTEWLKDFFELQEHFLDNNTLNKKIQEPFFKVFLRHSELLEKNNITNFVALGTRLLWDSDTFLGLMLINLVSNNPQFEWYVKELCINRLYTREDTFNMLSNLGQTKNNISSIVYAFKRISETPFGSALNFGHLTDAGEIVRTKCSISDYRVILYGLFKFAEKCNDHKAFTLSYLLDDSIERDGISPTKIFGLERDEMIPILLGLSAKYPEFISASFTHDLEKITLSSHKTSADVLELFKED